MTGKTTHVNPGSRFVLLCRAVLLLMLVAVTTLSCQRQSPDHPTTQLRLAVTTSFRDSGLADELLPVFEKAHSTRIELIANGTGAALATAANGDVDLVIVHSEAAEKEFMDAGHGLRRTTFMFNSFLILGPADDPAAIRSFSADQAMGQIASKQLPFVSRGDRSGTHQRELDLWRAVSVQPDWKTYLESGQGMGATLLIANEKRAYTLCDRGTWLKFQDKVDLIPLVEQGQLLLNPYSAMVVHPNRTGSSRHVKIANQLLDFLMSEEGQQRIGDYRVDQYQLFRPIAELETMKQR